MTLEINRKKIIVSGLVAIFALYGGFIGSAAAQSAKSSVQTAYGSSYDLDIADATRPVTVSAENHLYYPGERVAVKGTVWGEVVDRVESLNIIRVEVKAGNGNVVAMSDAEINRETGAYEASLKLPDNASGGTYSIESRIELEADALGIVKAITSATLQSSARIAVAQPQTHEIAVDNRTYSVKVASNSALDGFEFKQQEKAVSIFAEGETGTTGVMEITIPKDLLSGEMSVFIDNSLAAEDQVILKNDTETETTFEINYSHSIHNIEVTGTNVVPEFPSIMIMGVVAAIVGVMVTVSRKMVGRSQI